MKRIVCVCLLVICGLYAYAQEFKVAGCYKWQLYSSCKRILDTRFNGGQDSYQGNANELCYYDVRFGGVDYDIAVFKFGQGHLEAAEFYSNFPSNDVNGAKSYREDVLYKVADVGSYGFDEYTNDDGFKCYEMKVKFPNGYNGPNSGVYLYTYGVKVNVMAFRSQNKEGKNKIFVGLFYEFNPWQEDDI